MSGSGIKQSVGGCPRGRVYRKVLKCISFGELKCVQDPSKRCVADNYFFRILFQRAHFNKASLLAKHYSYNFIHKIISDNSFWAFNEPLKELYHSILYISPEIDPFFLVNEVAAALFREQRGSVEVSSRCGSSGLEVGIRIENPDSHTSSNFQGGNLE